MKKVATRKQVINNAIVFGFISLGINLFLCFTIPILGIPLLGMFIIIWPIAGLMAYRQAPKEVNSGD